MSELGKIYDRLGEMQGKLERLDERSEANTRKLDGIDRKLEAHDGRLRGLESVAERGRGALRTALWFGGAATAVTGAAVAAAKWLGWTGKG